MQGTTTIALMSEKNRLLAPVFEHLLALQKFCESNALPFPPAELQELLVAIAPAPPKNDHQVHSATSKRGPDKQPRAAYTKRNPKPFTVVMPEKPDYGPRPEGAGVDWKAPLVSEMSGLTLSLYILKDEGGAAPSSKINARLAMLRPGTALSTASMVLNSLKYEQVIEGDFRMWKLKRDVKMILGANGDRMWCAVEELRQQDRASLRREVILAALKVNPRMTVAEISECLRRCEWLAGVTVEPDQVKGTLRLLGENNLVVREGALWKLKG